MSNNNADISGERHVARKDGQAEGGRVRERKKGGRGGGAIKRGTVVSLIRPWEGVQWQKNKTWERGKGKGKGERGRVCYQPSSVREAPPPPPSPGRLASPCVHQASLL